MHTAAFCIVDGPVVCFALDACLHLEGLRYDEQQEKACWASAAIAVGAGLAVLGCVPPGLCSTSTESHVLVRAQGQAENNFLALKLQFSSGFLFTSHTVKNKSISED